MPGARQALRQLTARHHERVDAVFAGFDLSDGDSYRHFLMAHARVLPRAEEAIQLPWAGWTRRAPLLAQDLADLGGTPELLPQVPALTEPSAQWGGLYVLEGSRLGGAVLARRVADGFPRRYLSASHSDGGWRAFQDALEAAAAEAGAAWLDSAIAAAQALFESFEAAARLELGHVRGC